MSETRKIVGIHPKDGRNRQRAAADVPVDAPIEVSAEPAVETISPVDQAAPLWIGAEEDSPPETPNALNWPYWSAAVLSLGWAAYIGWLASGGFRTLPAPDALPAWVGALAAPIALLLLLMLIVDMRSASATQRHLRALARVDVAHGALVERLETVNIAWANAQLRLDEMARAIATSSSAASRQLVSDSDAISDAMAKVDAIATSVSTKSEAAARAMDAMNVALPKVDAVASRAADTMREAGQLAYQHGGAMEAQVAALRTEMEAAGISASTAGDRLRQNIDDLRIGTQSAQDAAADAGARFAAEVSAQRDAALAMVAELTAALEQMVGDSAARVGALRQAADTATSEQIAAMDGAIARTQDSSCALHQSLSDSTAQGLALEQAFAALVTSTNDKLEQISTSNAAKLAAMDAQLAILLDRYTALDNAHRAASSQTSDYAERAENLAALVEGLRRDVAEQIPGHVAALHQQLATNVETASALPQILDSSGIRVDALVGRLRSVGENLAVQENHLADRVDAAAAASAAEGERLSLLEARIAAIGQALDALSSDGTSAVADKLRSMESQLAAVQQQAHAAIEALASGSGEAVAKAVDDAIARAGQAALHSQLAEIRTAGDSAAQAAQSATEKLMRQLITIADSSAALEARAQSVAENIEAAQGETLARQLTTLTESLQSQAIDLTKLIDVDVADQTWESYLKGDRSIFARRAFKLLSNSDARTIRKSYDADDDFRALVNRYIHDFEAMLRAVIDRRDGQQLAVTLLSSDIGKSYVALAQAIDRLRG
ncbi:MAG: hypothetical protein IT553_06885 [Sphingomonadaceae bacterium]|nr:hypothetical protein [Sphingomonadaceae bacterium]